MRLQPYTSLKSSSETNNKTNPSCITDYLFISRVSIYQIKCLELVSDDVDDDTFTLYDDTILVGEQNMSEEDDTFSE